MATNKSDEFEDDLGPGNEEPLDETDPQADEDWDSYDEQQTETLADEEDEGDIDAGDESLPKKKSSFNKILIIGAVVAVAGIMVMQFTKGAPPAQAPAAPVIGAQTNGSEQKGGLLSSPQELAKLQEAVAKHTAAQQQANGVPPGSAPILKEVHDVTAPPMPAAMAPAEQPNPPPVESAPPSPLPVLTDGGQQPATPPSPDNGVSARIPNAQDVMLKSPGIVPAQPATISASPPIPNPAPSPVAGADNAGLNAKIDTVLSRLDALETEVNGLKAKSGQNTQIDALKESVHGLEKKISSLENLPSPPSASAAMKPVRTQAPKDPISEPEGESAPAPKILGSDTPSESLAASMPAIKKSASPKASTKVSTQWVLRGAQPGQAMVAKTGESDTKTVVVGNTLPGIGKVTLIDYQDGRWVVQGTQGRIVQ